MGLRNLGIEKIAARPLDFIWILDVSGSMHGERIESLNFAIKEAIPAMQDAAKGNINADISVRVMTFSDKVSWPVFDRTPVKNFKWNGVSAGGLSHLGSALKVLADELDDSKMPERGLPPVLVLVTDGEPTDDYKEGLEVLMNKTWGKKAIRLAISISKEVDQAVLEDFISNKNLKPIEVENASQLTQYMKLISTQVISSVSLVKSDTGSLFNFDFKLPDEDKTLKNDDLVYDIF